MTVGLGIVWDDAEITFGGGVKSLSALGVLHATITADWFGGLTTKADSKRNTYGDFQASLTANSHDAKGVAIGAMSIAGWLGDTGVQIHAAYGSVGAVTAKEWKSGTLAAQSLKSLQLTATADNAVLDVDNAIGSISAVAWLGGSIHANSLGA